METKYIGLRSLKKLIEKIGEIVRDGAWLPVKVGRDDDENIIEGAVSESRSFAKGKFSHAEGYNCRASGIASHAEGYATSGYGDSSHSEGRETYSEAYSHAEGYNSNAIGIYSHAEGQYTNASGETSHAEGNSTIASGKESHAEGYKTEAKGNRSHAEGQETHAEGICSHAEGYYTQATGHYSHVEGMNNLAKGFCSHVEGKNTNAIGNYSHAEGVYNYAANTFLHMIGVGNSDGRKNACIIYVKRGSDGIPDFSDTRTGYMYLLNVGGYQGREIGNAKSVQEIIADLTSRIVELEKQLKEVITKPEIEEIVEEREEEGGE